MHRGGRVYGAMVIVGFVEHKTHRQAEMQPAAAAPTRIDGDVLPDRVAQNTEALGRIRTFCAVVAGVVAGVLGLTGLGGAVFFVVAMFLGARLTAMAACGGKPEQYFVNGSSDLFALGGLISGGGLTYLFVWMVAYDAIYVF